MPDIYRCNDLEYFYLIEDYAVCTYPEGVVYILSNLQMAEVYLKEITWKEMLPVAERALENTTEHVPRRALLRFLYASPLQQKMTLPRFVGPSLPVYRYECQVWSDEEEHPNQYNTQYNTQYNFDYVYIQKERPFVYICKLPHGFVDLVTEDMSNHKVVGEIPWEDVQKLLDKEIQRTKNIYVRKMLLRFML